MFSCTECGKKLGFKRAFIDLETLCVECSQESQIAIREEEETKNKQIQEEREKRIEELLIEKVEKMKKDLSEGKELFLYKTVYIPVDSILLTESLAESFNISIIQELGFEGWEVISIVPKTIEVALENISIGHTSGQTWGAGMGGNVAGVHVLLKKNLSIMDNMIDKEIKEYVLSVIRENFNE